MTSLKQRKSKWFFCFQLIRVNEEGGLSDVINAWPSNWLMFAGVHGPRNLWGHVSIFLDSVHSLALREVDDEPVGNVALGLYRFHPLQEKDLSGNLTQSHAVFILAKFRSKKENFLAQPIKNVEKEKNWRSSKIDRVFDRSKSLSFKSLVLYIRESALNSFNLKKRTLIFV